MWLILMEVEENINLRSCPSLIFQALPVRLETRSCLIYREQSLVGLKDLKSGKH